jgi:hypothetical protein
MSDSFQAFKSWLGSFPSNVAEPRTIGMYRDVGTSALCTSDFSYLWTDAVAKSMCMPGHHGAHPVTCDACSAHVFVVPAPAACRAPRALRLHPSLGPLSCCVGV